MYKKLKSIFVKVNKKNDKITDYILRYSKKREKDLKYDFLPSMLDIIERPAHIGGTVIITGIFTLLIIAIIWASIAKVDIVVTAGGSVKPEGDVKVIRAYSSGVVKKICVKEGEYAKQGDVLLELDTDAVELDTEQINNQIEILEVQLEFYKRIAAGEDIRETDVDAYSDELKSCVRAIVEAEKSYNNLLGGLRIEVDTCSLNVQLAKLQLEQYKNSGSKGEIITQELIVRQYELAYQKAELSHKDAIVQHDKETNEKITELSEQNGIKKAELGQSEIAKDYQIITAPVSGYINRVDVNAVGDAVASTQELLTMVPEETPTQMVGFIKNMDIADIQVGYETEIKLEAYPYSRYGTIKGEVTYISPGAFMDEKLGNVYMVKASILNSNEHIKIIPGLTGSIEVKAGRRRLLSYFLDPITKGLGESLKEK